MKKRMKPYPPGFVCLAERGIFHNFPWAIRPFKLSFAAEPLEYEPKLVYNHIDECRQSRFAG